MNRVQIRKVKSVEEKSVLTDKQKKVFDLKESGLTFAEIAREMGVNPSGVRGQYVVAKRKMEALKSL